MTRDEVKRNFGIDPKEIASTPVTWRVFPAPKGKRSFILIRAKISDVNHSIYHMPNYIGSLEDALSTEYRRYCFRALNDE